MIGAGCKSEWVCFEHTGYAREKAIAWWRKRSDEPIPATAAEAVESCEAGMIADTDTITVRSVAGEKYDRIVSYELGDKPFYREPGWDDVEPSNEPEHAWADDEEIPF
jgi:DNA repair protein RadD